LKFDLPLEILAEYKRFIMKRLLTGILIFLFVGLSSAVAFAEPADALGKSTSTEGINITTEKEYLPPPYGLSAAGAVVLEQNTGKVLYGSREHERLYPASTTKILTAMIAAEFGHLDDIVTVGDEISLLAWDGSKAYLTEGERISLRDLVYGLLINSGNDAANTIAVHIARSESGKELTTQEALNYFAGLMNKRAKKAGAFNSNFVNPHGYHDPNHYTTAYDLAMIGRAAMESEFFRQAVSAISMDNVNGVTGEPRFWRSKNKLLNKTSPEYYEYATGSKTGYTSKSGQCLVSFASKDGLDLVAVVMKSASNQQWGDTRRLFEYGFSNYEYYQVLEQGTIVETLPVDNYASDDWGSLSVEISSESWGDLFHKKDIPEIKQEIKWDESLMAKKKDSTDTLPRLEAPIVKGQTIGELTVTLRGKVLTKAPLTAVRDVKKRTVLDILTPQESENGSDFNWFIPVASIALAFILLKIIVFFINRKRRRQYYMYRRY
jgi:D-alanyl-D-alanine carboxypeptidase (penicillin-binding protein 5/6)